MPLHFAVFTRTTHDPETRTYVERRRAEGRTTKEVCRCLKRYLARQLYRILGRTNLQPGLTNIEGSLDLLS